jgi:hypothetical protein
LKRAAHVHQHHPVPFLFADLLERLQGEIGEQGGIVDQDVHGAEFAHRIGHKFLDRLLRRDVRPHIDGGPLRLANALGDRAPIQDVGNDHLGARGGKRQTLAATSSLSDLNANLLISLKLRILSLTKIWRNINDL